MHHRQLRVRRQAPPTRASSDTARTGDEERPRRAKVQRVRADPVVLPVEPRGWLRSEVAAVRAAVVPRSVAREDEVREHGLAAHAAGELGDPRSTGRVRHAVDVVEVRIAKRPPAAFGVGAGDDEARRVAAQSPAGRLRRRLGRLRCTISTSPSK